jgi:hypothetical protein
VNGWTDGRRREARERETRRTPQHKRGAGKQTWSVCRKQGCDRKLRSDNRSGFCFSHHTSGGQCQRCLGACTRNHPVCQRCRVKGDQERAERVAPCTAVGCKTVVHGKTGLCRKHWREGGEVCRFPACTVRVVFGSLTGLCSQHGHRARTERRRAAKGQT